MFSRGDLRRELSIFTGKSIKEVDKLMTEATQTLADEWKSTNPQTQEEAERFYRETPTYIYDLAQFHVGPDDDPMNSFYMHCVKPAWDLLQNDRLRVLDFGGGIGSLSIRLAQQGHSVYYYDLPSKTKDFAEFRFNYHAVNVGVVDNLDNIFDLDCVLAIDVLEHISDLELLIHSFHNMLRLAGLTYIDAPFSQTDEDKEVFPMHQPYNGLHELMVKNRFVLIGPRGIDVRTNSQRLYQKQ